jgi:hypothetical protein
MTTIALCCLRTYTTQYKLHTVERASSLDKAKSHLRLSKNEEFNVWQPVSWQPESQLCRSHTTNHWTMYCICHATCLKTNRGKESFDICCEVITRHLLQSYNRFLLVTEQVIWLWRTSLRFILPVNRVLLLVKRFVYLFILCVWEQGGLENIWI